MFTFIFQSQWLAISYLIGLSLAPGAVSGLCKILPSLSASSIDHEFFKIGSRVAEHHRLGRPEDSSPIGSPVPTPHQGNNRETDIMPFIVVLIAALVAMLWTWLMIPETAGLRELEDKDGNEQGECRRPFDEPVIDSLFASKRRRA